MLSDIVRLPHVKPPGAVHLLPDGSHGSSKAKGFLDHFLDEGSAARLLHHGGGNIAGRDDPVLRRGRGVHHERVVEARHVHTCRLAVLDMNHRRLRERRQQLVSGLRRKGDCVWRARRLRRRDRVIAIVEFVEICVGVPSFVEVEHLNGIAEALLDRIHVVAKPVIGGIGHHHQTDLATRLCRGRVCGDLCSDRFRGELIARDRTDDAEAVARGRQVDRRRAGHDQRMQDRFVAIAVAEDDIAAAHRAMPDDLVRCGGAADDE